ncbi:MAG: hypothetical protein CBC34_001975 [Hyphomicrobiaceae bacterium TMED74]|nr:hypothetical protein [Filomicrobium sp.]RPG47163.1 MAG: hypothetical protein CBC34_001975 [Hyphomicrobiaceae bacterium TMED74]
MRAKQSQNNPFVIVGRKEGAYLVNLSKPWRLVCATAKLDGVRIHDLRHSFAGIAAAEGASLHLIGKLLRHSQPATTAQYAHLTDEALDQMTGRIGQSISTASTENSG